MINYNGTIWHAKDDSRSLKVLHEAAAFRGERMFLVQGLGSGRTRLLSLNGLIRRYLPDSTLNERA